MQSLAVYVEGGLPFAQDLSLENSADSYLCFWLALLHPVSYLFFLYQSPSSSLQMVFNSILSDIDEVLSINPSANVFVLWDFNVHHRNCLTYSGGTDWPGKLHYNFSISNNLTQMVNFTTRIPDCDSHTAVFFQREVSYILLKNIFLTFRGFFDEIFLMKVLVIKILIRKYLKLNIKRRYITKKFKFLFGTAVWYIYLIFLQAQVYIA